MPVPATFGNGQFLWTDGAGNPRVHQLSVPLKSVLPSFRRKIYQNDSADLTVREVITVGNGVHELSATIDYDDDPSSLIDLVADGAAGAVVTYVPDSSKVDQSYDCYLIAPTPDQLKLSTGKDWPSHMEYAVTITLRRVDGSAFSP